MNISAVVPCTIEIMLYDTKCGTTPLLTTQALVEVIITSEEELFVRAVILLGELLHLVSTDFHLYFCFIYLYTLSWWYSYGYCCKECRVTKQWLDLGKEISETLPFTISLCFLFFIPHFAKQNQFSLTELLEIAERGCVVMCGIRMRLILHNLRYCNKILMTKKW